MRRRRCVAVHPLPDGARLAVDVDGLAWILRDLDYDELAALADALEENLERLRKKRRRVHG